MYNRYDQLSRKYQETQKCILNEVIRSLDAVISFREQITDSLNELRQVAEMELHHATERK
jgi:hypothetical protein